MRRTCFDDDGFLNSKRQKRMCCNNERQSMRLVWNIVNKKVKTYRWLVFDSSEIISSKPCPFIPFSWKMLRILSNVLCWQNNSISRVVFTGLFLFCCRIWLYSTTSNPSSRARNKLLVKSLTAIWFIKRGYKATSRDLSALSEKWKKIMMNIKCTTKEILLNM